MVRYFSFNQCHFGFYFFADNKIFVNDDVDSAIFILIECKAPEIKIAQATFDQIARYNMTMKSQFLMVTNGLNHYFCQMDFENEKYHFLEELPNYKLNSL